MEDISEFMEECQPVLLASQLYADYFNSFPISKHIKNVIGKSSVKIVPYCYFYPNKMDYEKPKGVYYHEELFTEDYPVPRVDFENTDEIINYIVPSYKKHFPKNSKFLCGMIGVPILQNPDDDDSDQDHYVSFVFKDNVLYYFDSAIDKDYRNTETYIILSNAFDGMSKIVVNSNTFEEAGGVSENPFNFVAQNIFCHTWSIWFIYLFIVLNKSITQINNKAGKGLSKNKHNLILIKTFIYNELINLLKLDKLLSFGLFDYFRFIIVSNNKNKIQEIIEQQ